MSKGEISVPSVSLAAGGRQQTAGRQFLCLFELRERGAIEFHCICLSTVRTNWMSSGQLFLAIATGKADEVARLLEDDDSLVNSRNGSGQSPLHVATSHSLLPMMDLLLSYGANMNLCTDAAFGGLAPLHVAARFDLVEAGRKLVMAGANPNVRAAGSQSTPLHQCAQFGSVQFASWLLSIPGVESAAADASGFVPQHYAKKGGFLELARVLPVAKYDLWKQVETEPNHSATLAGVKATLERKAKIAAKKAEALEKKKKKKLW